MNGSGIDALRWAFSPCPNDTFIFGALALGLLPSTGTITPRLEDIDALNAIARQGGADVVKVSAATYPTLRDEYQVLPCGGAMGEGVGPLLVRRAGQGLDLTDTSVVAHPGAHTTAFALFRLFHPEVTQFRELLFSDIEHAVQQGQVTHGLLIHEGRFTYQKLNLFAEEDIGNRWGKEFNLPLPLGVILVKRTLPAEVKRTVHKAIERSINYAWTHADEVMPYVTAHAQEMEPEVQRKHINLYVNDYSKGIGAKGERALRTLWSAVELTNNQLGEDLFFRG